MRYKINKITLKLQLSAKGRIEKATKLKESWENAYRLLTNQDKFELDYSAFLSAYKAKEYFFKKVFTIFSKLLFFILYIMQSKEAILKLTTIHYH